MVATLRPNETQEIGMLQAGWMIVPNEAYDISVPNYAGVRGYGTYRHKTEWLASSWRGGDLVALSRRAEHQ